MDKLKIKDAELFKSDEKWFLKILIEQDLFKSTNTILFPKVSIPLEDLVLEPVQTFEGFEYRLVLPWNKLIPYKDDETDRAMFMGIRKKNSSKQFEPEDCYKTTYLGKWIGVNDDGTN